MKQLTDLVNSIFNKKHNIKRSILCCLTITFVIMLIGTTIFPQYNNYRVNAEPINFEDYDKIYYVSASGDDTNDGSYDFPFKTLTRTTDEICNLGTKGSNYLVIVMSDLISTACARYFDNSVTITSLEGNQFTVTRGTGFSTMSDVARGWYNPPMLEIESSDLTPSAPLISLTLSNIIFDDAYLHEGSVFSYAPTDLGASGTGTTYVQDSIVASYAPCATIILGDGAELRSFGGMTAARVGDGATLIMEAGSLITDVGSTTATRQVSATITDYRAVGETAVSVSTGSHFYMYDGAKITNIANAHSVKLSGTYKCFIDGEITGMKGNRGWDATDRSTSPTHEGRGFKSAVFFSGGTTIDPDTGSIGSAIIGPNANIHHNQIKCGAIGVSRSTGISVRIYGKINDNIGQNGTRWQSVPILGTISISYGTNGGGIYIVAGGTVILEDGSEVCRNSVTNMAYGGGINVQQHGSKLIMNGGLVENNTASGMGSGIAVNKGDCYFEMNGGIVNNGPDGVLLFNNRISLLGQINEDGDCNGRLVLNGGTVSGVTVNSLVAYGTNTAGQYRSLYISENVAVKTGYVAVAGAMQSSTSVTNVPRQVKLLPVNGFGGIDIGNPNKALYPAITAALPKGWTMPTTANNVIALWMKKAGVVEFSVPAPTSGSGGANYNTGLKYFAAVLETNAAGVAAGSAVKFYPTKLESGQIVVSVPLGAYANGAMVALVQPSSAYGEVVFDAPSFITYVVGESSYTVPYTGEYDISLLLGELLADGHAETNTAVQLIIHPDYCTLPEVSSFDIASSDIFELDGVAVWDHVNWELVVPLKLKSGWNSPTAGSVTTFVFDCEFAAADFVNGGILSLTGELKITGGPFSNYYFIAGNYAETELIIPDGSLNIIKILLGDAVDVAADFHFTVTFSDGGTYDGIISDDPGAVILKGGENHIIMGIPHDITYTVVEVEANQNGYVTTSIGASGTIISNVQSEAKFTNTKNNPVDLTEYLVMYYGTGHTGGLVPVDVNSPYVPDSKVTVLGQGDLVRVGYSFLGWSLTPTATVVVYVEGDTFYIVDDVSLYVVWAPISYTVTYAPGVHGTFAAKVTSGLRYGDATPAAPAVTGETGWTFTGWQPTPTAIVTGDAIYTAQWTQTPPTTTPLPTATLPPTTPPSTSPPTTTTAPPTTTTPQLTSSVVPPKTEGNWALVNLILSIVGVVMAIIVTIRALLLKKKENNKKEDYNKEEKRMQRKTWLLVTIALAIIGIVVFLFTEDMSLPMRMVDKWTIVHAILLIAEFAAIACIFKRKNTSENNQNSTAPNANINYFKK
jgi:hypothetical protein